MCSDSRIEPPVSRAKYPVLEAKICFLMGGGSYVGFDVYGTREGKQALCQSMVVRFASLPLSLIDGFHLILQKAGEDAQPLDLREGERKGGREREGGSFTAHTSCQMTSRWVKGKCGYRLWPLQESFQETETQPPLRS